MQTEQDSLLSITPLSTPAYEESRVGSSVKSDILSTFMQFLFIVMLLAGYHFFYVSPALQNARIYYVLDLDALMEAKVNQIIERERKSPTGTEEQLLAEAHAFREMLGEDLLKYSDGYPIFQKRTVLRADSKIVDLTPILASQYGFGLKDDFPQDSQQAPPQIPQLPQPVPQPQPQ